MTSNAALSAAILAGGKASRFAGQNKALADFGGRPILVRQLAVLRAVTDSIAIVGGDRAVFEALAEACEFIHDERPDAGPMAGLAAALMWSPTTRLFVVACDLPLINHALIEKLVAAADKDVDAVATVVDGRVQPLAAIYDKTAASEIKRCLDAGLLSPRRLFDASSALRTTTVVLDADEARAVRGFNSQAELDSLRRDCNFPK